MVSSSPSVFLPETMPHGVAVVDALKSTLFLPFYNLPAHPHPDFIRHGKNAAAIRHRPLPSLPPPFSTPPVPQLPPVQDIPPSRGLRQHDRHHSIDNDIVQSIVDEERRQNDTMPSYNGLDDYSLDRKMGEYVHLHLPYHPPFILPS